MMMRGGEVRYLVGLITRRSQVQILTPLMRVKNRFDDLGRGVLGGNEIT